MPRRNQLSNELEALAASFANAVLAAIRTAPVDELLRETNGAPPRSERLPKTGRLPRRSAEDIAYTLDRVVVAIKKTRGKGMRAEEIRKALGLDVREVPRVLKEGLAKKRLRAKGQKRATTYFAR